MTDPTPATAATVESLLGLKPPLVTIQQPYQPVCACGWMGQAVYRRALAVDEAREHEATHPLCRICGTSLEPGVRCCPRCGIDR